MMSDKTKYILNLTNMALSHRYKADNYRNRGELEGALINYTLSTNELYTVKDLIQNQSDASNSVTHTKLETAIRNNIKYIVPLQIKLKELINQRQCICKDPDDKKTLCVDVSNSPAGCMTFDEIAGQNMAKEQIKKGILYPILYPRLYPMISKGLLFYGPPGTGKTMLAKGFVNELQREADKKHKDVRILFYAPTGASLKGKYVGETEKKITKYFDCASQQASSCDDKLKKKHQNKSESKEKTSKVIAVLFIDEIEAIAGNRAADSSGMMTNSVNTLLQMMDGVNSYDNVIVMAATNYPWKLDDAILRRFDVKVFVSLPDANDIMELIKLQIGKSITKQLKIKEKKKKEIKKQSYKIEMEDPLAYIVKKKNIGCTSTGENPTCPTQKDAPSAICCGENNEICLSNNCNNSTTEPKLTEIFSFYRNRYFPDFTDDELFTIAKLYEQKLFSGGDVANACKAAQHLMADDAKRLNNWQASYIEDPAYIVATNPTSGGKKSRGFKKTVQCIKNQQGTDEGGNNFLFLRSDNNGENAITGDFTNPGVEKYLVFNNKSPIRSHSPYIKAKNIKENIPKWTKKFPNAINIHTYEDYLYSNVNTASLDAVDMDLDALIPPAPPSQLETILSNSEPSPKTVIYVYWDALKIDTRLKNSIASNSNLLSDLEQLINTLDKLFSLMNRGDFFVSIISLRQWLSDREIPIDIILKMKLDKINAPHLPILDRTIMLKIPFNFKKFGSEALWHWERTQRIVTGLTDTVASGTRTAVSNTFGRVLSAANLDRDISLIGPGDERSGDDFLNSLKNPAADFPFQITSLADSIICIDKLHHVTGEEPDAATLYEYHTVSELKIKSNLSYKKWVIENTRYNQLKKCLASNKIVDDTIVNSKSNAKPEDCGIGVDIIKNLQEMSKDPMYMKHTINLYKTRLYLSILHDFLYGFNLSAAWPKQDKRKKGVKVEDREDGTDDCAKLWRDIKNAIRIGTEVVNQSFQESKSDSSSSITFKSKVESIIKISARVANGSCHPGKRLRQGRQPFRLVKNFVSDLECIPNMPIFKSNKSGEYVATFLKNKEEMNMDADNVYFNFIDLIRLSSEWQNKNITVNGHASAKPRSANKGKGSRDPSQPTLSEKGKSEPYFNVLTSIYKEPPSEIPIQRVGDGGYIEGGGKVPKERNIQVSDSLINFHKEQFRHIINNSQVGGNYEPYFKENEKVLYTPDGESGQLSTPCTIIRVMDYSEDGLMSEDAEDDTKKEEETVGEKKERLNIEYQIKPVCPLTANWETKTKKVKYINLKKDEESSEEITVDIRGLLGCKIAEIKNWVEKNNPGDRYLSLSYRPGYFITVTNSDRDDSIKGTVNKEKMDIFEKYKQGIPLNDDEKKI